MRKFPNLDTLTILSNSKKIPILADIEDLELIGKLTLMTELHQSLKKETGYLSNQSNCNKKLWEIKCTLRTLTMETRNK